VAGNTPEANTVAALLRTLAPQREPAGVVYLVDGRFEDDQGLEDAIARLRERRPSLSVVGSEAACLRGWSDGTPPPLHRSSPRGSVDARPGVSQHPFGPGKPDAAWHGGETAFPPQPYRWHPFLWATEFDASAGRGVADVAPKGPQDGPRAPGEVEDLLERFGKTAPENLDGRTFPLPSAFGPYGLSRFAAETGGRYVLWSWSPSGRARVTYEWGRCDSFPPDLRSRKDPLADLPSDPHASAMLRPWHLRLQAAPGLVEHLPPVDASLRGPRAVAEAPVGTSMPWTWDRVGEL